MNLSCTLTCIILILVALACMCAAAALVQYSERSEPMKPLTVMGFIAFLSCSATIYDAVMTFSHNPTLTEEANLMVVYLLRTGQPLKEVYFLMVANFLVSTLLACLAPLIIYKLFKQYLPLLSKWQKGIVAALAFSPGIAAIIVHIQGGLSWL